MSASERHRLRNVQKRKSELVRELVNKGDIKAALRIAKDFRLGLTEDQSKKMKSAYECMLYPRFYEQIGKNIASEIEQGTAVLQALYGT